MTVAGRHTIVFAVCHPDDEAIWCGGLLHALSQFDFIRACVVCVSGQDISSSRVTEFEAARRAAGYAMGTIVGGGLRPATDPLPNIGNSLADGLARLGLLPADVSLLITHSPYGDEHRNPHHVQAYRDLHRWSCATGIPFGFFSCIQLPYVRHVSLLRDLRRKREFRLLQFAQCDGSTDRFGRLRHWLRGHLDRMPRYYLQFLCDARAKSEITGSYGSIGIGAHDAGYAAFSNPCEALYLMDDKGLKPFEDVIAAMPVPGASPLVETRPLLRRAMDRLRNARTSGKT